MKPSVTSSRAHTLLNSKKEFHQTPIIRVVAASGLHGDQGGSPEATIVSGWRGESRGGEGPGELGAGEGMGGETREEQGPEGLEVPGDIEG